VLARLGIRTLRFAGTSDFVGMLCGPNLCFIFGLAGSPGVEYVPLHGPTSLVRSRVVEGSGNASPTFLRRKAADDFIEGALQEVGQHFLRHHGRFEHEEARLVLLGSDQVCGISKASPMPVVTRSRQIQVTPLAQGSFELNQF